MPGWHRLWVLVSGIYLILVIVFFAMSLPKPELIPHSRTLYDQLAPELKKKIVKGNPNHYQGRKREIYEEARKRGLITEVKMPNGHIMVFDSEIPEKEREDVVKEYWSVVEKSAAEQRMRLIGLAFGWWILPVLLLYAFGWLIGWVYRGFRK